MWRGEENDGHVRRPKHGQESELKHSARLWNTAENHQEQNRQHEQDTRRTRLQNKSVKMQDMTVRRV